MYDHKLKNIIRDAPANVLCSFTLNDGLDKKDELVDR